jgi:hypothetical protein
MKALTLLALLSLTTISILAEESKPDSNKRAGILVKMQVYSGKKATLQPVMRAMLQPSEKSRAFAELEKLVTAGSVETTSELTGETLADGKYTSFQGESVRFAIGFDPPNVILAKADDKTSTVPANAAAPAFGYAANAFDKQNVGTSLTLTPTLSEVAGEYIASADWSRSWLVKWDEFEIGRLPNNEKILIKQPRFAQVTSGGSFAAADGEWTVLGFHSVPGTPDRSELVLLQLKSKPAPAR